MDGDKQEYTIELKIRFYGTYKEAEQEAYHAARLIGGEYTGLLNEAFEEV